ncbi:MAG: glycosyltransferase family 9 protein [Desulfobulbus sp.]
MSLNEQRILIVKQSSLGDIIHTLPVVHALKRCFPKSYIGWVVEKGYADLLCCDDTIDTVHAIHIPSTSSPDSTLWSYWKALTATVKILHDLRSTFGANPYNLVLDLHASFRSGMLSIINPGGTRYGFRNAREFNTFFQHHLIDIPPEITHAVEKNLLFASTFHCSVLPSDFRLCSSPTDEQAAIRFLEEAHIDSTGRFVYVNTTARWQSKFWLAERWGELCDRLISVGIWPILGGSSSDLSYIQQVVQHMKNSPIIAAGKLSLTESVALLKRSTAYVGLDTGPMHIAAMAGIPVVALFGPTHPERVGPYGVRQKILRADDVSCLCCRKRICSRMDCMRGISVEQVYTGVLDLV